MTLKPVKREGEPHRRPWRKQSNSARPASQRTAVANSPSQHSAFRIQHSALSTRRRVITLAVLAALGISSATRAASWDPLPATGTTGDAQLNGGPGIWDLTSFTWTNDNGQTNSTWINGDTALFGGNTGGVVNITSGISASALVFNPTADFTTYTLQSQTGVEALTLIGPQITANTDATINAILTGSAGLAKSGPGTLTLGGANTFFGSVAVTSGRLRLANSNALGFASDLAISGGAIVDVAAPLAFNGNVAIYPSGGTIALSSPGSIVALGGVLTGSSPLVIDGSGGGSLTINNPANFDGVNNSFTGNIALLGGGSVTLGYTISAPAGQSFSAGAGTLILGNSIPGATVTLASGASAIASGNGVIQLFGRAAFPGTGNNIAGDLTALAGGRIEVGDGLDDSAQIAFASSAHLTADGGTIILRPRALPLTLDNSNLASLSIRNGGTLVAAGNADLIINRDIDQAGAWTIDNQSPATLRIAAGSQDTTAGLTLRAENGLTRYESDTITLGAAALNGTLNVDLRGGTIDINSDIPGKTFNYAPGYIVSGWGQLGTSAANQTHIIPAGGVQFYAHAPAALGGTLSIVGGIDQSAGSAAAFRIGNNNGLSLSLPNSAAAPYTLSNIAIDPQSAGNVARLIVASGAARANAAAFISPNNAVRFEIPGGTLISDISQTGTLLLNGPGSLPINVTAGGTFITSSSAFLLKPNETLGSQGTIFGFNGTTTTALTLNGQLDLNGTLGASIAAASTGLIRLDAGETLTLGAQADLLSTTLAYAGATAASATLEVNAPGSTVRIGSSAPLTSPFGFFGGTREFKSTNGTLQIDAADASTVSITGFNQLSVDRTNNGIADPTVLGTLTLSGGAFQVGTTASTMTIAPGAILNGRGTIGHATAVDTFINNGTIQAQDGQLTLTAATIKGSGTWDPNGQTILLTGAINDVQAGNPTMLRIIGANGGKVQLGQSSTYTGGTLVDGSSGTSVVALRVTAAGALGSGAVTLNSGALQLNSDNNLNYGTTPVNIIGSGPSTINYDHLTGNSSRTHNIGALSLGGQTLNLAGPATSAYNYTLNITSTTVSAAGATIVNTSGSPVNAGPMTLNGNLSLALTSFNFTIGALSGPGTLTRSAASGTLTLSKPASGFSGGFFTSVGTTNFTSGNALSGGTYTFAGGTMNINSGGAGALAGATGTMRAGGLNLNTANALDGAMLNLASGNITANAANSLGSGNLQLTGGKLILKQDASSTFGGAISLAGTNASFITVDRSSASGAGGTHTINSLTITNQQLNLTAGNTGYGLAVAGATTINGATGSTIDNEAALLSLPLLQLNGSLTFTGTGITTIGQLAGTSAINFASGSAVNLTAGPQAGFASPVQISSSIVNVNNAASLAGGSVQVTGGTLNLGIGGALAGTSIALNSGFISANAPNALTGVTLPITNGTLFAAANNSLGNASINLTGGNITATAPGALGSANISLDGATLALRSDTAAAFGGNVTLPSSNFSTVSVARLTAAGGTGNILSINNLSFGGQTLNVTGADGDIFAVLNPITLTGSSPTTINTTAADAIFQGTLTGSGALIKTGVQSLTLNNGGTFAATTVSGGTLVVNNSWNTSGVTIGSAAGPATLQMGGSGNNTPGNFILNSGTLRIAKGVVTSAIPLSSTITAGNAGNVEVEYTGLTSGTLANNITVDTSLGARTLTLSSASGNAAGQSSTFTYSGLIVRSGANALTIAAQADTALDDGAGNLIRPPSRLVLAGNQTFTTDLQHAGGIVIAKGNIPAGATANPLGTSSNPLQMNVMDSTIGGMVADGQSSATFLKAVTTSSTNSPRKRLGAFYNAAGAAGTQTITFQAPFTWNDGSVPLYVITPPGNPASAAAVSTWNGLIADPQTVLQINNGAMLDNILTTSGSSITSTAPIYIGGGGTVRFNSNFDENTYRNLASAKGLAGTASVLDNTTLQSSTAGHHFDAIELRTGTYQVSGVNQTIAGGLFVNPSPFDPARNTSSLITDFNLNLTGVGATKAFKIASGQTLQKSGAGTLNINGDQAHSPGSTFQASAGVTNFNTDAGMNAGGLPQDNLSLNASTGGTINLAVTQHLAQVNVTGGLIKLSAGATSGTRTIKATSVNVSSGKFDLTNNRLIVDYSSASPIQSIRQQIVSGYNVGGTLWSGNGIISSNAGADAANFALGYGESSDLLGPAGGNFGAESADGSAVLVRYTKIGDANLDGSVDFSDLVRVAQNYNRPGATLWSQGDFNYDGSVNFQDLVKVAQNYSSVLAADPIPGGLPDAFSTDLQAALSSSSVPEPRTLSMIALAATAALTRRSRRGALKASSSIL